MLGERDTTMITPRDASSMVVGPNMYKLDGEAQVKDGNVIAPAPRPAPSVPTDISDEDDDDDSGEDDRSPTSNTHPPRGSSEYSSDGALRQQWNTTKEHQAASSPLTELIRAFEMLKRSPYLDDISETDSIEDRKCAQETRRPQSAAYGDPLARRRHSEYALQYGVVVVPSSSMQHDSMQVRTASWEKRMLAASARPRAMSGPLEPDDVTARDNDASKAKQQPPQHSRPAPSPTALPSMPTTTTRRPEGFRARRPALLRIETSGKAQVPRLPQRRRKPANGGSAPPRSVSNPAMSALQRDAREMRAVTKLEWDALHAGAEIGMAPYSCVQTSLVPSSCVFPPSILSRDDDEADRQPPTTAELRAAIIPYPMFTPPNEESHRAHRGAPISKHVREPADHSVHAWTLKTYNALLRDTDDVTRRRPPALRTTSLQVQKSTHVHFSARPETMTEEDGSECEPTRDGNDEERDIYDMPGDNYDMPGDNYDALVKSPSYTDAFILEERQRPVALLRGLSLQRTQSDNLASDSSASEFGEVLTAPPVYGRGWHRGRCNAICTSSSSGALPYRPAPLSSRWSEDEKQTDKEYKKRRHMSASAAITTFRSAIASWSRTSDTHKRKPLRPWKSPYPGSVAVMASSVSTPHKEKMADDDLLSPQFRRPSTARGQRGDRSSRIASLPVSMLNRGAQWEASRHAESLRSIGSKVSPTKRDPTTRSSSISFALFATRGSEDGMETDAQRLPQRKRTQTKRSASYGLGLQYPTAVGSRADGVPFPSSAFT